MKNIASVSAADSSGRQWTTVGLCLMAAILEGFDLQSAGVAGPGMRDDFGLDAAELGWIFSASILGLLPGAALGGRLADHLGRKRVLIGSMLLFGVFSIATALSWDYPSLLVARFLTGIGLGAAMPNLIALTSESVEPRFRNTAVAIMYAGMPLGGLLASIISFVYGASLGWHSIFYVGGIGPLIVAGILYWLLPESILFKQHNVAATAAADASRRESVSSALFGGGRAVPTALLWLSYFFTLVVLYFLQNWLPTLAIDNGFSRETASTAQILFNVGGIIGSVLAGLSMDRGPRRTSVAILYLGLIGSMIGLAFTSSTSGLLIGAFGGGLFSIGGQMVLYGLAPTFYHTLIRGTGVGAAVAVGRLGSVAGPIAAGQLLSTGSGTAAVITATFPGIVIAAIAVQILLLRSQGAD